MDIHNVFLTISTLLAFSSPFFYAHDILKGKARPHRTTRLVLLVITALAFLSLLAQHDTVSIWLAGIGFFQCTVVFLLSLKYGMGGWEKLDIGCLGIAALGILIWKVTNNPVLALYASIFADFTGFFPTIVKTYTHPKTESLFYFLINFFATIFNVLAIQHWSLQTASYSLYLTSANLLMVFLLLRPRLKKS